MKFTNKSVWETQDLKNLFKLISKDEGYDAGTIIVHSKGRGGGRGGIGYKWIKISIPSKHYVCGTDGVHILTELQELRGNSLKGIARVFVHEIKHNEGLRHKDIGDEFINQKDFSYLDNFVVRRKVEKQKVKVDLVELRKEKALKKVDEYVRLVKRYNNLLKKWQKFHRKVKYYEKKKVVKN